MLTINARGKAISLAAVPFAAGAAVEAIVANLAATAAAEMSASTAAVGLGASLLVSAVNLPFTGTKG